MSGYIEPNYKFPMIVEVIDKDPENTKVRFDKIEFNPGDWITADRRYAPCYHVDSNDGDIYTLHIEDSEDYTYHDKWIIPGIYYQTVSTTIGEFDNQY